MQTLVEICRNPNRAIVSALHSIHKQSLPGDITPNLSPAYYARVVALMGDAQNGFLHIATTADRDPVGFCFTALRPGDFSTAIARQRWLLLSNLARLAITKPGLVVDLAGAIVGRSTLDEGETTDCPEVYVICVRDDYRSKGVGAALIESATDSVRGCGHSDITVKTSDAGARAFYERHGFRKIGEQNRVSRKLAILKRNSLIAASR